MFCTEQHHEEQSSYRFMRSNSYATDTLSRDGKGALVRSGCGLIWSGFRPSDDACRYGYLIPSNMFAVVVLGYLEEIAAEILEDEGLRQEARALRFIRQSRQLERQRQKNLGKFMPMRQTDMECTI